MDKRLSELPLDVRHRIGSGNQVRAGIHHSQVFVDLTCRECGKPFKVKKFRAKMTTVCGVKCAKISDMRTRAARQNKTFKLDENGKPLIGDLKNCEVCSEEFLCVIGGVVTCSKHCRDQLHLVRKLRLALMQRAEYADGRKTTGLMIQLGDVSLPFEYFLLDADGQRLGQKKKPGRKKRLKEYGLAVPTEEKKAGKSKLKVKVRVYGGDIKGDQEGDIEVDESTFMDALEMLPMFGKSVRARPIRDIDDFD